MQEKVEEGEGSQSKLGDSWFTLAKPGSPGKRGDLF
jgi:hypothetical protein